MAKPTTAEVTLVGPAELARNPENPRLIFRQEELDDLEKSIADQGILVPLTVYRSKQRYVLLDGERRWRCALKLGLSRVPVILQPQPDRMTNVMMMFAIHHARRDWDPLPTALKLEQLEGLFTRRYGRTPTESELAKVASLTRGEVRRLKKLLELPKSYRTQLMRELEKPRSQQVITVDHVLEATRGAAALRKRAIIDRGEEDRLRKALLRKVKSKVITSTVAPRKLARLARAVERGEIEKPKARAAALRLIQDEAYSLDEAYAATVESADIQHGLSQLAARLNTKLHAEGNRDGELSPSLQKALEDLGATIRRYLAS